MPESLINWYLENKRELPWRETNNPYKIWLSEIILQQTRVEQGLNYYYRFCERYPDIYSLANASVDDVLLIWQGLGYYSRARNLHFAANQIVNLYQGKFPETTAELLKIKGIGKYTAAAIASIAFKVAVPVVDGNVQRVLSRFYACDTPIDSTKGSKEFEELAWGFLDRNSPETHNQAMMELGALICKPISPKCFSCPLSNSCNAFADEQQHSFPVKQGRIRVRSRYIYYYIVTSEAYTFIQKRRGKDIWQGLFEFPLLEFPERLTDVEIIESIKKIIETDFLVEILEISGEIKHILSHQIIFARFIHLKIKDSKAIESAGFLKVPIKKLENYAFPRLITKYTEEKKLF